MAVTRHKPAAFSIFTPNSITMQNQPLTAPVLEGANRKTPATVISRMLDTLPRQSLTLNPWTNHSYIPEVAFTIAHQGDCIFLKYYVTEKFLRAACILPNSPVYTDSCVEFFIEPEPGEGYYNMEFNSIGTCLAGFGKQRQDRVRIPEETIRKIKYRTRINNDDPEGLIQWELALIIPLDMLCFHRIASLQGLRSTANFYKCGDELPEPHYLSWEPVTVTAPDFHRPDFFGKLNFE